MTLGALALAIERLESLLVPAVRWPDLEFHSYEPFEADLYVRALEDALALASGRSYLEVGCGIGTKLVIAKAMGLEVTGIELRPLYAAMARALCPDAEIVLGDARSFAYGAYDIVYSYKPCVDEMAQQSLEHWMNERMKPTAVWVNAKRDTAWLGWREAAPHVWVRV